MKKIFTIVILSFIGITQIHAQCFQCDSNTKAFSIGVSTTARGNNSFAGGVRSVTGGENSFVFGESAKVTQSGGIAFGNFVESNAANSIVFGKYVTGSGANSITFGAASSFSPLLNSKPNSIMFGVTEIPSLTIVKPTGANLGYVGIGTDNPKELVHVTGNILSEGDLTVKDKITLTEDYTGNIYWKIERNSNGLNFVNVESSIVPHDTSSVYRATLKNRLFISNNNGYVGIGTTTPAAQLDVNGSFKAKTANITGTLTANAINVQALNFNYIDTVNTNVLNANSANISGKVNIGTSSSNINLDVKGIIRTEEIKVCLSQGCDYVFEDDYNLMNLNDLNSFIKTHKHLPDVAPAAEMEAEGINVSEMNALLLQKVEELTLYILDLQNQINELKKQ